MQERDRPFFFFSKIESFQGILYTLILTCVQNATIAEKVDFKNVVLHKRAMRHNSILRDEGIKRLITVLQI